MRNKSQIFVSFLFSVILFSFAAQVEAGQGRKKCLDCHGALKERFNSEHVHKPLLEGNCSGCHNPHASRFKGLLNASPEKVCFDCHRGSTGNEFSREHVHAPVKEGKCVACHNPHTSPNKKLLVVKKSKLCLSCHKRLETLMKAEGAHSPFKKGECIICHEPHSSESDRLIKKGSGGVCSNTGCHPDAGGRLVSSHSGFTIAGSNCVGCHNPHQSSKKSLLRKDFHKPVAEKKCALCHVGKSGKKLKNDGIGLCLSCHKETVKSFEKINSHLVGDRKNLCLGCHNPHASDTPFLLAGTEERVCFACHQDSKAYQMSALAKVKHPNIEKCSNCHVTHGSDNNLFLIEPESKICGIGSCHDKGVGFTHPMGKNAIDKRNNKEMTCLSCHNPMGTQYDKNLILEASKALCEECHRL